MNSIIEHLPEINQCQYCGSNELIISAGNYVCSNCGVVLERITVSNTFKELQASKTPKIGVDGKGMGSETNFYYNSKMGRKFNNLARIRKMSRNVISNETVCQHFQTIYRFASDYEIPFIARERIFFLFRKFYFASQKGTIEKITNHSNLVIYACLVAIREHCLPISMTELYSYFKTKSRRVSMVRVGKLILLGKEVFDITLPASNYSNYLAKYLSEIILLPTVQLKLVKYNIKQEIFSHNLDQVSRELYLMIEKEKGGISPCVLATNLIYSASVIFRKKNNLPTGFLSQKEIALATGISEFSIRTYYRKFLKKAVVQLLEQEGN